MSHHDRIKPKEGEIGSLLFFNGDNRVINKVIALLKFSNDLDRFWCRGDDGEIYYDDYVLDSSCLLASTDRLFAIYDLYKSPALRFLGDAQLDSAVALGSVKG